MISPLAPFTRRTRIAYFSMEIAMRPEMHTYAGGLGMLAGDTARSCADLELQVVFVTLVSRAGYFRHRIDPERGQLEEADWWEPAKWCVALDAIVAVPTWQPRPTSCAASRRSAARSSTRMFQSSVLRGA